MLTIEIRKSNDIDDVKMHEFEPNHRVQRWGSWGTPPHKLEWSD